MRKAIWILSVLAVAVAIGGYVFFSGERKAPIRYKSVPIQRGAIVSAVTATGSINPMTTVQVGSQVSGMIESLHADFNSSVTKGQVVARIDPFPYRAKRDQASANLSNAKAVLIKAKVDLSQRKRELDRVQSLLKQEFVSQAEVDAALTAHEGAIATLAVSEAAVKQAAAALEAAELDLTYTVIRSPVDGNVISRMVEVGQRLSASFSIPMLFLIAEDLTQMQVDAAVSESDIGGMSIGKEATFTVDAYPGVQFQGRVRQVRNAPVSVQNVVTYDVVIGAENKDLRLKPGMTANVAIILAQKDDVLKVPIAALRFTPPKSEHIESSGGPAVPTAQPDVRGRDDEHTSIKRVWKLSASGDPEVVPVQVGISDGNVTEIIAAGLSEADEVIIGIEMSRNARKQESLPPGFGSGQPRRPRERGM
ncbi:MAG: efflux RND transporter periplasmic adaptor subunit [Nitrospirota bacterium]|nr:efflux RND transporter periplasmic adaptor subunit [Nitrospirota bacterium]